MTVEAMVLQMTPSAMAERILNQRKQLRDLEAKCRRQEQEIRRMEDNGLRMLVQSMGYSEGEA